MKLAPAWWRDFCSFGTRFIGLQSSDYWQHKDSNCSVGIIITRPLNTWHPPVLIVICCCVLPILPLTFSVFELRSSCTLVQALPRSLWMKWVRTESLRGQLVESRDASCRCSCLYPCTHSLPLLQCCVPPSACLLLLWTYVANCYMA